MYPYPPMHPSVTPREMAHLVNEMAASDYYRSPR